MTIQDIYTVASGQALYAGMNPPSSGGGSSGPLPAWAQSATIGQWMTLPTNTNSTASSLGIPVDDFAGWAITDTGDIYVGGAGGHGGSVNNGMFKFPLMADAPSWSQVCPPSATTTDDTAYNPDGKPASCHLYHSLIFVKKLNRIMRIGCYGTHGNATAFPTVDGFNITTNTWDAQGTYPDILGGQFNSGAIVDANGDIWTNNVSLKGTVSGSNFTWSSPTANSLTYYPRYPWALDTTRNQFFGLCWGNGQGFDPQQVVAAVRNGNTYTAITLTGSGLSQFQSDQPGYAGMDYDPINDRFLFYQGFGAQAGRIYIIKPNNTATWDISIMPVVGAPLTSSTGAPTVGSGINSKFTYVPALKGFVALPKAADNIQYMRLA